MVTANPSKRFHSIRIPSEWGYQTLIEYYDKLMGVSIRLGSPASGDWLNQGTWESRVYVSIRLGSPASGDLNVGSLALPLFETGFPFD